MKTEISEFCANYSNLLRSLLDPLQFAVARLDGDPSGPTLRTPVAALKDVQHRLDALIEKLDGQKAYLLIFGPLKSGKSTLMNAIGGAYVSEVTAMPAYPALVYLGHGESLEFTLTSYEGTKLTLRDSTAIKNLIAERHQQLADLIRDLESQEESFDPGVHAPGAIRRIDVRLPVMKLREGSTVLVDTPGLYSRMKFGYDLMTRTFRNSAACAVFVVKTDNLFLEQVFDEFNELLGLFSRIFLVVNIDSRKLDLQPDGSLRQSIEAENPERIVEAFKSLSMTAPLRRALDEGRLRIYPIDLLMSASLCLRQSNGQSAPRAALGGVPSAGVDDHNDHPSQGDEGSSATAERFDQFISDLTEYLNSSAYLAEFMKDSLQQGLTLTGELGRFSDGDAVAGFRQQQAETARSEREIKARLATVRDLEAFNLRGSFARVREDLGRETTELVDAWKKQTVSAMNRALDQWMDTPESLRALIKDRWNRILQKNYDDAVADISAKTAARFNADHGGADLPQTKVRQLEEVGFDFKGLRAAGTATPSEKGRAPVGEVRLSDESIPVNRSFFDRVFFRRPATVRLRLFGAPDQLDREIPPTAKRKRLLPNGKETLEILAREQANLQFGAILKGQTDQVEREYIDPACRRFSESLASIKRSFAEPLKALEVQVAFNVSMDKALNDLRAHTKEVEAGVDALASRYAAPPAVVPETDPSEPVSPAVDGDSVEAAKRHAS